MAALKRKALRFGVPCGAAFLVGVIVTLQMGGTGHTIETPRYLVAKRDLTAGQPINDLAFTIRQGGKAPAGAVTDQSLSHFRRAATAVPLEAGEVLTREKIRFPRQTTLGSRVPKGKRAYFLAEGHGLGLNRGDKVDVLFSPWDSNEVPRILAEGAPILRPGPSPVIAVLPESVPALEKAGRQGKLTLVLRNPGEDKGTVFKKRRVKKIQVFTEE